MKKILSILFLFTSILSAKESYGVGITIGDFSEFHKKNRYEITRIEKGSEAEVKGLKTNDIILSIQDQTGKVLFKSEDSSFKELFNQLVGHKDSEFQLTILRKSTQERKTFKLKRKQKLN